MNYFFEAKTPSFFVAKVPTLGVNDAVAVEEIKMTLLSTELEALSVDVFYDPETVRYQ